jgi:DNA polymerase III subunit delta'
VLSDIVGQPEAVAYLKRVVTGQAVSPLLLIGDEGVGKRFSVLQAIGEILAEDRGANSSEVVQFQRGVHPDVETISAPADKDIGVDPIRNMIEKSSYYPSAGPFRFFIIDGVDRMTPAAENAILKTLEEPPAKSRFFLLAESNDRVIRTIRSRCGRVPYRRLPESFVYSKLCVAEKNGDKALVYARMGEGSIGRATRYWGAGKLTLRDHCFSLLKCSLEGDLSSSLAIFDEIGTDLSLSLKFLRFLLHDILVLGVDAARLINVDLCEDLKTMRSRAPLEVWAKLSAELRQVEERHESGYINLHFHVKTALISAFGV